MGCNTLGTLLNSVIQSSSIPLYSEKVFCERTSIFLSHMYFGHEDYKNKINVHLPFDQEINLAIGS